MSLLRTKTWLLAVGVHLLLAGTVAAQSEPEFFPGATSQTFRQPDYSTYGRGVRAAEGWFFGADLISWTVSTPNVTTIGHTGPANLVFDGASFYFQPNTLTSGYLEPEFELGNRYEGGYMEDGRGWLVSGFHLYTNNQDEAFQNVGMNWFAPPVLGVSPLEGFVDLNGDGFDDDINANNVFGRDGIDVGRPDAATPPNFIPPPDGIPDLVFATDFGDLAFLPVFFDRFRVSNRTRVGGFEVDRLWRIREGSHGGSVELIGGVRYFDFNDRYSVETEEDALIATPLNVLANSYWVVDSYNRAVGPQVGLRAAWKRERITISTEGRFMAAANFQSQRLRGQLGSLIQPGAQGFPLNYQATGFNDQVNSTEFTPLGELRVQAHYQVFRGLSVKAGWTGIAADGIARSISSMNYFLPQPTINTNDNEQEIFMQGWNIGFEFNR